MREADSRLVERSLAGEKGAYFELVRRHQGPVVVLGYALTGDRQEAHDLCQETFLRSYRSLRSFRGARTFGDWLFQNLRAIHEEWKKKKEPSFERLEEGQATEEALPGARVRAYRTVAELLAGLPDSERRGLVRWHLGDHNARDVADALGETPANVKAIVSAAHKRLRESLEQTLDLTEFDA